MLACWTKDARVRDEEEIGGFDVDRIGGIYGRGNEVVSVAVDKATTGANGAVTPAEFSKDPGGATDVAVVENKDDAVVPAEPVDAVIEEGGLVVDAADKAGSGVGEGVMVV